MIKLIVSDVDGTLVEDGSADINPELFEVILKLREKGIQFAIASGRPWFLYWLPWPQSLYLYD